MHDAGNPVTSRERKRATDIPLGARRVKIYEVGASLLVQGVRLVSLFVVTGRVALEGRPRCGSILSVSTSIVHSRRWPW